MEIFRALHFGGEIARSPCVFFPPGIHSTVEPYSNKDLGDHEKYLAQYQVSCYNRVKNLRHIKKWDKHNYLIIWGFYYVSALYNEVPLYMYTLDSLMIMVLCGLQLIILCYISFITVEISRSVSALGLLSAPNWREFQRPRKMSSFLAATTKHRGRHRFHLCSHFWPALQLSWEAPSSTQKGAR